MASKPIFKLNNGAGEYIITFLADTIADIDEIQTDVAIGSKIICLENKAHYILSTDRIWVNIDNGENEGE